MTSVDRQAAAEVARNLAALRQRIEGAAERAGRDPAAVTLVGAAKGQPPERLRAAAEAGLRAFGENRVQEAEAHREVLAGGPRLESIEWHLIGPLQSNKAKRAAELFSTVHSVDRLKIARHLDRAAGERGAVLDCFLEVNLADEESKAGFPARELAARVAPVAELRNLRVAGLMAIPPNPFDPEESRPWFRRLRELSEALAGRPEWPGWPGKLSMGMSADFEVAVEEGATHVRVGTALFGERG
ncbi:MAG TPA: YggS family pyridoxal phosphate-dependent enzyme [Thermoanaerobaculia bacterium]|nr:YggS family pyridoxal phosphate-dependent enzyme [Thermoanaerobaculia bacterium]